MDSLINRYRNITVLLLVIMAQLILLAVQVRNDQDVRMIRVWSVTAVTPLARVLEGVRGGTFGFVRDYFLLRDVHQENRRLKADLDRLKMENLFLKTELSSADRAVALAQFQSRTPSRTLAARVITTGASANSKVVFVDRGASAGVQRGMAVVTPDGIVGKVIGAYPTASEVLLATDPDFAAGVISQKNHVRGTLKGQGYANCKVDYVANEEKIEVGEMFYTSGDDRIFPKGFPVGTVRVAKRGTQFQEILVEPAGLHHGVEEVLILLEGVHQEIPEAPAAATPVYIAPPPPAPPAPVAAAPAQQPGAETAAQTPAQSPVQRQGFGTEADRLRDRYKAIGDAQGHKFGEGLPGSKPPNFNLDLQAKPAGAAGAAGQAAQPPVRTPGAAGPAAQDAAAAAQKKAAAPAAPPRAAAQSPDAAAGAQKKAAIPAAPAGAPPRAAAQVPDAAAAAQKKAPASAPATPPAAKPKPAPAADPL